MFGLLSNVTYQKGSRGYCDFRNNYCGTCKTIGAIYGNKERLILNHDVVFLSELLSELNSNKDSFYGISVGQCFKLPSTDHIPHFLRYCASVNILLAYYKIHDNERDSRSYRCIWNLIKRLEIKKFNKAQQELKKFNVDTVAIENQIRTQFNLERHFYSSKNILERLQHYSAPTRKITGEVYACSVNSINRPDLSGKFRVLGEIFGELVYAIDALEDYENDFRQKKFNPLRVDSSTPILTKELKTAIAEHINIILDSILTTINCLPFCERKKKLFAGRLSTNIQKRLTQTDLYSFNKYSAVSYPNLFKRAKDARIFFNSTNSYRRNNRIWQLKYLWRLGAIVLLFVFFPQEAYSTSSIREADCCSKPCCDLICTISLVGTVFACMGCCEDSQCCGESNSNQSGTWHFIPDSKDDTCCCECS